MAQTYTETLREKVYNFVLRSGAAGLTDEEISRGLNIAGDVERPRRNELVMCDLIIDSGYRRKTLRGRTAKVWLTTRVADKLINRI